MQKLLLIRGFKTDLAAGEDHYRYLKQHLSTKYDVTYFNYAITEDIKLVYARLGVVINEQTWDVLMGHSLGGGLLTKYIRNNDVSKHKRVILLMPYIGTNLIHTLASFVPFARSLYLPTALLLPSAFLYEGGSILKDSWELIPVSQPSDMYSDPQVSSNDFSFINNASNIYLFYASLELFNNIDNVYLEKILPPKLRRVDGLHESFFTPNITKAQSFYSNLDDVLGLK